MENFLNSSFLDGPEIDWEDNIIADKPFDRNLKISRILKLEHLISQIDKNCLYFSWPGSWQDQNDSIFLRTKLKDIHQRGLISLAFQKDYFAQCWCKKNSESDAMWQLYASQMDTNVMITSTVGKVMDVLWDKKSESSVVKFFCGFVKYVPMNSLLDPCFFNEKLGGMSGALNSRGNGIAHSMLYKCDAYDHEHEFRFIANRDSGESANGFENDCYGSMREIIDEVILKPNESPKFEHVVKNHLAQRNINIEVRFSELKTKKPEYYFMAEY